MPKPSSIVPLVLLVAAGQAVQSRDLSFAERVQAQSAIERVYHAHRSNAARPFEDVVSRAALEQKVESYLAKSAELERRWHTPITSEMLAREVARMTRNSRMPERLQELFAALDHDRALIEECLARPALVARLTASFRASSQESPQRVGPAIDDGGDARRRGFLTGEDVSSHPLQETAAASGDPSCGLDDVWDNRSLIGSLGPRRSHTAVWTGTEVIVWGGNLSPSYAQLSSGRRYDPATDTWAATSRVGAPAARDGHAAVWNGTEMIVWGGLAGNAHRGDGGRYDPVADRWRPISTLGAPQARRAEAVWTGTEMIVWGGGDFNQYFNDGARYDPQADVWRPMPNGPSARVGFSLVWTGTWMIVWGGFGSDGVALANGGRYDPVSNSWSAVTLTGAPLRRFDHTAVSTGSRMIVWGGRLEDGATLSSGAVYDPQTNQWSAMSDAGRPVDRDSHTAVWTGSEMIVWGGHKYGSLDERTGGRYDPTMNRWLPTRMSGAPASRMNHTATWTGSSMIVLGGGLETGGRYDPAADSWTPTSVNNGAPTSRTLHTAVWTGSHMIVWGGREWSNQPMRSGGLYDPALDTWTETSLDGAPEARWQHSAVWTGDRMVVWGGRAWSGPPFATGGRYDPLTDTWAPVRSAGAPEARAEASSVWTGEHMIVWGGEGRDSGGYAQVFDSGGRYDPVVDHWEPVNRAGAPTPRTRHSAVWSGTRMLVWGGEGAGRIQSDVGGLYDPAADTWSSTTPTGAPTPRQTHSAVWTGNEMILWGGITLVPDGDGYFYEVSLNDGKRYSPETDSWSPVSLVSAPGTQYQHSAVWTGERMIVWGGGPFTSGNRGGAYDPHADRWTAISSVDAPENRARHSAVWTEDSMIVWGGDESSGGGRYFVAVDLDGDGLSGGCDNCPHAFNPFQQETDGDAEGDVCDVDDGMVYVSFSHPRVLDWQEEDGYDSWNVYAGDLAVLRESGIYTQAPGGLAWVACGVDGLSFADDPTLPAGEGRFYLVTGVRDGVEGSLGTNSAGEERPNTNPCP